MRGLVSVLFRRPLSVWHATAGLVLVAPSQAAAADLFDDFQDLPRTLWTDYRGYMLAAFVIFILQLALISALWVLRRRSARAELAQRRSEARNTAILNAIPDLMFVISGDGVYLDYHVRDRRDLLVPPEQFLGKHIRDVIPGELGARLERQVKQASLSPSPVVAEYVLPMPDGDRHYEARLVPCDADTVMSVVRDVTQRFMADEQLHKAHMELAQASRLRALGAMAANIAHEVSQPLAAVLLNAQSSLAMLNQPSVDVESVRDAVADIVLDGQRARDVITRIRGLAKQTPLRAASVSINDVVDDVMALSQRLLRERAVRVQLGLISDLPDVIGDRIQLQQVLLNLVHNAIDAMETLDQQRRLLAIESGLADDAVVVRVKDSGPGICEENVEQVFTPFFTTKTEGMGMGLPISRSIAETHGGHLRIAETSSDGSTFELQLPAPPARTIQFSRGAAR